MLVGEFLERSVRQFPEKTAVVDGNRRLTYRGVDRLSSRLANALVAHGVQRGDRVGILLENCSEAAISIFGILKAGAVFVMLDPTTKVERLQCVLGDCGASALVLGAEKLSGLLEALDGTASLKNVYLVRSIGSLPLDGAKSFFSFSHSGRKRIQRSSSTQQVHRRGPGSVDLHFGLNGEAKSSHADAPQHVLRGRIMHFVPGQSRRRCDPQRVASVL